MQQPAPPTAFGQPPTAFGQPVPGAPVANPRARYQQMCADKEVKAESADDLYGVLTTSRIVLVLDDSGSMSTRVQPPGSIVNAFAPTTVTRWSELNTLAATVVDIVTSTTPEGVDVHFLNRGGVEGVTVGSQLAAAFNTPPAGGTPLVATLQRVFTNPKYLADVRGGRRVIVLVITDGEPSEGTDALYNLLACQRPPGFHVSMAEANDNEEEMAYLDGWDTRLRDFDNTDDYGMERARVLAARGAGYKFTYTDYAIKIILGAVLRKYWAMDQRGVTAYNVGSGFGASGAYTTSGGLNSGNGDGVSTGAGGANSSGATVQASLTNPPPYVPSTAPAASAPPMLFAQQQSQQSQPPQPFASAPPSFAPRSSWP